MHTLLYASSTQTSTNVNASSVAAGTLRLVRHIALHCIQRLAAAAAVQRSAQCPLLLDATTSAANATSLKHVRRPKHITWQRHESKQVTRCQGRSAMAGKMLLVRHLTAVSRLPVTSPSSPSSNTRTWPTSHDRPFVSPSCLAQIVKHPIDDVRDSAVRRSLQGWSATARGTYICSAGTARSRSASLWRPWLAARDVAPSQSYSAASPPR